MARDKKPPRADTAGDPEDDPALQSEVRAFAASLGLSGGGGGGGGGGFAFDDFAPPTPAVAKQRKDEGEAGRRKDGKDERRQQQGKDAGDKQGRDRKQPQRPADAADRREGSGAPPTPAGPPAARDPIRERGWNAGAGPRPASLLLGPSSSSAGPPARSVLPKDDPAVWHEAQLPLLVPPPAAAAPRSSPSSTAGALPDPDDPSLDAKRRKELRRLERRRLKQQQQRQAGGADDGDDASAAASPLLLSLDDDTVERLRQRAEALLEAEAAAYEQALGRRSAGDARWLQQVRKSGTTADRVAAMTLLVQVRFFRFLFVFFVCFFLAGGGRTQKTRRSHSRSARLLARLKAPREFIRAER
jgi:ribosome biogenesis protein MAK21